MGPLNFAVRLAMETGCHTYKQRRLHEDRPGDIIRNAEAFMTQIAAVSGACICMQPDLGDRAPFQVLAAAYAEGMKGLTRPLPRPIGTLCQTSCMNMALRLAISS